MQEREPVVTYAQRMTYDIKRVGYKNNSGY